MRNLLYASVLLLPAVAPPAPAEATVAEIVKAPEKYDGKWLVVKGTVDNVEVRATAGGNEYTRFDLVDGDQKVLARISGRPSLNKGDKARLTGTFSVKVMVGDVVFKNQIQVSPSDGGKIEKVM
jgi:hypothetical protein